ncbi:MAG: sulfotransferase [Phycisphaerales bacterium]|nr:sulfotransferase [Phycisphaerales bacterium]
MPTNYFFIIGAQRSGTTWLYNSLDKHPDICLAKPVVPEPKHFLNADCVSDGLEGYNEKYFDATQKRTLFGEKSTSYIESKFAAKAIASVIPTAKIIAILREPISRAISNFRFSTDNGLESRDINDAFLNEKQTVARFENPDISVCPFAYLQRGRYAEYLKEFLNYFPKQQLKVVLYEDLITNQGCYESILQFLNVSRLPADLSSVSNQSNSIYQELQPETIEMLVNYYDKSNKELMEIFDLNLTLWNSVNALSNQVTK